jgi:hypothetical protein
MIEENDLRLEKQIFSREVSDSGMMIEDNDLHPEKQKIHKMLPILVL